MLKTMHILSSNVNCRRWAIIWCHWR